MQVAALEPRRGRGHDRGAGTADARHRRPPQAGAAGRGGGHDAAPHQGAIAGVEPNQQGRAHRSPSCRPPATPPSSRRHDPVTRSPRHGRRSRRGRHRPVTGAAELASSARPGASMRVLYCTDTYPPQMNGVSVVTALSVAGLTRRGWECAVVAPRYPAGADGRVARGYRRQPRRSPACPACRCQGTPRYGSRSRAGDGARVWSSDSGRTWCTARRSSRSAGWASTPRRRRACPVGLFLPHRLRPLCRGLRHALAPPGRDRLSPALPSPEPAGLHPLVGRQGGPRRPRRGPRSRSGDGESTRRYSIRVAAASSARSPGHGQPVHLRVRRAAGAGEAGGRGRGGLPAGDGDGAPGRHPPGPRRDGAMRGRARARRRPA